MPNNPKGAEGYKEFHEKLEKIIEDNWGIKPQFSDPFSWGYSSTGIYIKDVAQKEYVAMLAENSPEKVQAMKKNIAIANSLNLSVRTPQQLKTKSGEYLLEIDKIEVIQGKSVENKVMSLGYFLSGILPFDMHLDILLQAVKILHEIHQIDPKSIDYPLEKIDCPNPKFLHGDLTPSNMLIGYGKIVAVIDFELSVIGPVEYDLSRLTVFSWFRMGDISFGKLLNEVRSEYQTYSSEQIAMLLLKDFSLLHCQMHVDNIKKHKDVYETQTSYKEELKFAEGRLKILEADLAQMTALA